MKRIVIADQEKRYIFITILLHGKKKEKKTFNDHNSFIM